MAAWTKHVVAGPPPRRQRRAPPADPLGPLLERLAELVGRHAADGPRSLARDPLFWTVIDRLHARRPRAIRAPSGPPRTTGAPEKSHEAPAEPIAPPPSGEDEPVASALVAEVAGAEETETTDNSVETPATAGEQTPPDATREPTELAAEPAALAEHADSKAAPPGEASIGAAKTGEVESRVTQSAEATSGEDE